MSEAVYVLGLDPGFKNLGYAVVRCEQETPELVDAGVFHTEQSDKKRKVLSVEDNFRRTKEIAVFLSTILSKWKIKAICAEAMSHPPSASAAAKVAMSWGVIATLSMLNRIPVVQASPQEVKLAMCKVKSASKDDVETAVKLQLNFSGQLVGTARTHQEHAFDAAASALTCMKSDVILALRGRL